MSVADPDFRACQKSVAQLTTHARKIVRISEFLTSGSHRGRIRFQFNNVVHRLIRAFEVRKELISLSPPPPPQIVPVVYDTPPDLQRVYLHEVKNAINGNFLSQVFTSVGAGILAVSLPLANSALPLWPLGVTLIVIGVGVYWRSVRGAYKSWERRKVMAGQYTISSGGSGSTEDQG